MVVPTCGCRSISLPFLLLRSSTGFLCFVQRDWDFRLASSSTPRGRKDHINKEGSLRHWALRAEGGVPDAFLSTASPLPHFRGRRMSRGAMNGLLLPGWRQSGWHRQRCGLAR